MTELTWATIGGIVSVVIAQLLQWALTRGAANQLLRVNLYKEIEQLWVKVHELETEADILRKRCFDLETENTVLKKKLIILENGGK